MIDSGEATALAPVRSLHQALVRRIVRAYPSFALRTYCRIRFLIVRRKFLDAIDQYLPTKGDVLDIGSGFGTVSLYFGSRRPLRLIRGFELEPHRVETARAAAAALGLSNVRFVQGDAAAGALDGEFDSAYAIDIIHHLPREAVPLLLRRIHACLRSGGRFLIKDVDSSPFYKRWFSLLTDRVMGGFSEAVYYWPTEELRAALEGAGFTVFTHPMPDVLPYPHVLYVCEK
jgi:SAM-dependent methyltransferase